MHPPPVPAAFIASISICIKKKLAIPLICCDSVTHLRLTGAHCDVSENLSALLKSKLCFGRYVSRRLYNFWIRESESSLSQQSYIQDKFRVDLMPQAPQECKFPARVGMNCMCVCVFSKRWKNMFFVTNAKNIYLQYLEKKNLWKQGISVWTQRTPSYWWIRYTPLKLLVHYNDTRCSSV